MTQASAQQAPTLMSVAVPNSPPVYLRRRITQYSVSVITVLCGAAGTFLGTLLGAHTQADTLAYVFATLMILVAVQLLQTPQLDPRADSQQPSVPSLGALGRTGATISLATGFFGIGGGFLIVPALRRLGFGMGQAVPISLLVTLTASLVALTLGRESVSLSWGFAPLVVGSSAGTFDLETPGLTAFSLAILLAVKFASRLGSPALTRVYALLLMALALVVAGTARGGHPFFQHFL